MNQEFKIFYLFSALVIVLPLIAFSQSTDTLDLNETSLNFNQISEELQIADGEILIPGRVFMKHWYLPDAFTANPVFLDNENQYFFDPYAIPSDLSLKPFDEYQFNLGNNIYSYKKDSIKVDEPYTNLHYQIGSYQFSNI